MRFLTFFLLLVLLVLSTTSVVYLQSPQNYNNLTQLLSEGSTIAEMIKREVFAPSPLIGSLTGPTGNLTVDGIFQETNKHRQNEQLTALTLNETLNQAAQAKVDDMFAQQYFEHVSPDGIGPADLVENVGYQYIRVGENLALGNFSDDVHVAQAWMDSPGHRANILSPGFSEIGIAVGLGQYKEHRTWLAVQTFGLPSTACSQPNNALQTSFNENKSTLTLLANELNSDKTLLDSQSTQIEDLSAEISRLISLGNAKIEEGNDLVKQGNKKMREGDASEGARLQEEGQKLQQEGQSLIDQAQTKQTQLQQHIQAQEQSSATYNQKVARYNQLNQATADQADTINRQVNEFNTCVRQYQ